MANRKRHKSTLARAEKIKALTALHYEAGNQSQCYKAVWRRWIEPEFGICYCTYMRMLGLDPGTEHRQYSQPSLFNDL